jgi:hypothetical protein
MAQLYELLDATTVQSVCSIWGANIRVAASAQLYAITASLLAYELRKSAAAVEEIGLTHRGRTPHVLRGVGAAFVMFVHRAMFGADSAGMLMPDWLLCDDALLELLAVAALCTQMPPVFVFLPRRTQC